MRDAQIKYMVERFLSWRLPESFNPDGGVSFKNTFNDHMPGGPQKHEPSGTNLLNYDQATAMVRYMIEGLPMANHDLHTNGRSEMSVGEDRVRTKFNPSADGIVDQIKQRSAELINLCEQLKARDGRLAALAQTTYEEAAMWAVKAATA